MKDFGPKLLNAQSQPTRNSSKDFNKFKHKKRLNFIVSYVFQFECFSAVTTEHSFI